MKGKINLIIMAIFLFGLFATPILAYGGGGGGGGYGYGLPKALNTAYVSDYSHIGKEFKQSFYLGALREGQIKKLSLTGKKNMAIESINIWNKEKVSNVGFAVITTKSQEGNLYEQFDILENFNSIYFADIEFKIETAWANKFDRIIIEHIDDSGSISAIIPTFVYADDYGYSYYTFRTTSFSTFNVIGEKNKVIQEPQTQPAIEETEPQPERKAVGIEYVKEDKGNGTWFVIVVIAVILIVGYFLIRREQNKGNKDGRKSK